MIDFIVNPSAGGEKGKKILRTMAAVQERLMKRGVPYSLHSPSKKGHATLLTDELIKKGAMLTGTPSDILEFYGAEKKENIKPNLTEEEKSIVKVLSNGELHIEKICAALKRRVFEITPILSVLEIKGLVVKSGNVYALTRNDLEE